MINFNAHRTFDPLEPWHIPEQTWVCFELEHSEANISDDQHPPEPFVPYPAHDPADQPLPGEGADDMTDPKDRPSEADGDFGVPTRDLTPESKYYFDDEPIAEGDIPPRERD